MSRLEVYETLDRTCQRTHVGEVLATDTQGDQVIKFVCERCAHEIGGMPPYERFKAFCPNCKKLALFTPKKFKPLTAQ